ncbi:hypothetical protein FRB97_000052 [Tulasnella sp. 331]|nr:hypothetical protein FRB97_000052 [Tulasnella sp. 331]
MATQLPVEIIGRILAVLYNGAATGKYTPSALLSLSLVSPTFRAEAERLIYAHIHLKSTSQVVRCFQAVQRRPLLANYIRGLSIYLSLNSSEPFLLWQMLGMPQASTAKSRHLGRVMKPFGDLVTRTLVKMNNLQDYSLSLGGEPGRAELVFAAPWLPVNPPFRLRRFIVDLNLSPMMVNFLVSQPAIVDLLAPWFQAERETIPRNALPQLKTILCNSPMAAALVPRRPVRRVAVKDTGSARSVLAPILASLPELAKASVSVRQFDAAVNDMTTVGPMLWGSLQSHLPRLETITLRRPFAINEDVYAIYQSDTFTTPLASFSKLKHLVLPAPHPIVHLRAAGMVPTGTAPATAGAVLDIFTNFGAQLHQAGQPPFPPPVNFHLNLTAGSPDGGAGAPQPPVDPGEPTQPPDEQWVLLEEQVVEVNVLDPIDVDDHPTANPPNPPALVPFSPPPSPPAAVNTAPPGPAAMLPPLPPYLQDLMNMAWNPPPGNAGAAGGGAGAIGGQAPLNADNQAGAQGPLPFPGQGNMPWLGLGQGILIHGTITHNIGQPGDAPQVQPPNAGTAPAAPHFPFFTFGPGGANPGGPPPPQPPPPPPPPQQNPPQQNPHAGLHALGAQIQDTTTAIMNMIAQSQANVNQLQQQIAQTQTNLTQMQEDLTALETAAFGAGDGGGNGAPAGAAGGTGGGPFPPPPMPMHMPVNFNTTFVVTAGDDVGDEDGLVPAPGVQHRRRPVPNPRQAEVLEKARRGLKEKELSILEKWKLGGFIPNLKTVTFDMTPNIMDMEDGPE